MTLEELFDILTSMGQVTLIKAQGKIFAELRVSGDVVYATSGGQLHIGNAINALFADVVRNTAKAVNLRG